MLSSSVVLLSSLKRCCGQQMQTQVVKNAFCPSQQIPQKLQIAQKRLNVWTNVQFRCCGALPRAPAAQHSLHLTAAHKPLQNEARILQYS